MKMINSDSLKAIQIISSSQEVVLEQAGVSSESIIFINQDTQANFVSIIPKFSEIEIPQEEP